MAFLMFEIWSKLKLMALLVSRTFPDCKYGTLFQPSSYAVKTTIAF